MTFKQIFDKINLKKVGSCYEKIPYGIMNFKTLIEENYYYVDKTMYLEKLEKMTDALINLRPGRFGKSLFESMMFYYYDINSKDLFDKLFKGTYVYQNPTKGKNNYYVLKFDFSGIDSANKNKEELAIAFKYKVLSGIESFNSYYETKIEINKEEDVSKIMNYFLKSFEAMKLKHKIYIIIDEYDNFTNAIFEGDIERFKGIMENEGFIKAFYTTIKENMGTIIGKLYATGICPITLNSINAGLNILNDISTDIEFNSMIGFTHNEVKDLIKEVVEYKDREKIYNLMVNNYDGYLFNKETKERVFTSTLIMYLLSYYAICKGAPKELMDANVAYGSGKIENILKLKNNNFYEEILDELLKTSEINGTLKYSFNLLGSLNKDDLISLLYYFGYLTIKEYNEVLNKLKFKIPNKC